MMRKSHSLLSQHALGFALAGLLAAAVGGVIFLAIQVQGIFI